MGSPRGYAASDRIQVERVIYIGEARDQTNVAGLTTRRRRSFLRRAGCRDAPMNGTMPSPVSYLGIRDDMSRSTGYHRR